jgi:hypothetical protein
MLVSFIASNSNQPNDFNKSCHRARTPCLKPERGRKSAQLNFNTNFLEMI